MKYLYQCVFRLTVEPVMFVSFERPKVSIYILATSYNAAIQLALQRINEYQDRLRFEHPLDEKYIDFITRIGDEDHFIEEVLLKK